MVETVGLHFAVSSNLSPFIAQVNAANAAVAKFNATSAAGKGAVAQSAFDQFNKTLAQTGMFHQQMVNVRSESERFAQNMSSKKLGLGESFRAIKQYRSEMGKMYSEQRGVINQMAKDQLRLQQATVATTGMNSAGKTPAMVTIPNAADIGAVGAKAKYASSQFKVMHETIRQGSEAMINLGKNTQWAGRQMMVGMTIPIGIMAGAATAAFIQMDKDLVRIQKVYGSGLNFGDKFKEQSDIIRKESMALASELARDLGQSSKDTLGLTADIAATGKEGQALTDSVRQTSRLALLGEVDRQQAMKTTLVLQTAFKQNTQELAQSIDFMNSVENQTSLTLDDMTQAIPRAGATVKNLGGGIEELAYFMTAMKEGGVAAGEGANALKSGLGHIIAPTKDAQKSLLGFGIDIKAITTKNAGNLIGTVTELGKALETLSPNDKTEAMVRMFGLFQYNKMGAMLNNIGKQGSQTIQVMKLMGMSAADLAKISEQEVSTFTESASGKFQRAMESVKVQMAVLGKDFAGIFAGAMLGVTKFLEVFNNLPAPVKMIIEVGLGIAALIGPIVMIGGVLMNFFGTISKFANLMRAGFRGNFFEALNPELVAANSLAEQLAITFGKVETQMTGMASATNAVAAALGSVSRASGGSMSGILNAEYMAGKDKRGEANRTQGIFLGNAHGNTSDGSKDWTPERLAERSNSDLAQMATVTRIAEMNRQAIDGGDTSINRELTGIRNDLLNKADGASKRLDTFLDNNNLREYFNQELAALDALAKGSLERTQIVERLFLRASMESTMPRGQDANAIQGINMAGAAAAGQLGYKDKDGNLLGKETFLNDVLRGGVIGVGQQSKKGLAESHSEHLLASDNFIKNYANKVLDGTMNSAEALVNMLKQAGISADGIDYILQEYGDVLEAKIEREVRDTKTTEDLIKAKQEQIAALKAERAAASAAGDRAAKARELANAPLASMFRKSEGKGGFNNHGELREWLAKPENGGFDKPAIERIVTDLGTNADKSGTLAKGAEGQEEAARVALLAAINKEIDASTGVTASDEKLKAANAELAALRETQAAQEKDARTKAAASRDSVARAAAFSEADRLGAVAIGPMTREQADASESERKRLQKVADAADQRRGIEELEAAESARTAARNRSAMNARLPLDGLARAIDRLGAAAKKSGAFIGNNVGKIGGGVMAAGMMSSMLGTAQGTGAGATAMNAVNMAGMGAGAGMMLGPWGMAAGAVAGAGIGVWKKMEEAAKKASSEVLKMAQAFNTATAGFNNDALKALGGKEKEDQLSLKATQGLSGLSTNKAYGSEINKLVDQYGKDQVEALKKLDNSQALDAAQTMYQQLINNDVPAIKAKEFIDQIAIQAGKSDIVVKLTTTSLGSSTDPLGDSIKLGKANMKSMLKNVIDLRGEDITKAYAETGKQYGERIAEGIQEGINSKKITEKNISEESQRALAGVTEGTYEWNSDVNNQTLEQARIMLGLPTDAKIKDVQNAFMASSNTMRKEIMDLDGGVNADVWKGLQAAADSTAQAILSKLPKVTQAVAELVRVQGDGMSVAAATSLSIASTMDPEFRKIIDDLTNVKGGINEFNTALAAAQSKYPQYTQQLAAYGTSVTNVNKEFEDLKTRVGDNQSWQASIDSSSIDLARLQVAGFAVDWAALREAPSEAEFNIIVREQRIQAGNQLVNSAMASLIPNKPEDVAKAGAADQKDAQKAAADQQKAAQKALDADQKAMEQAQKEREKDIENVKKYYDDQIEAIQKAEDARQKAFDKEEKRNERNKTLREMQLSYMKAVASGDTFGAIGAKMAIEGQQKTWGREDENTNAQDAAKAKIDALTAERDAKTKTMQEQLDAQKEMDAASIESRRAALEAQSEANQEALDAQQEQAAAATEQATATFESHAKRITEILNDPKIGTWELKLAAIAKELGVPINQLRADFEAKLGEMSGLGPSLVRGILNNLGGTDWAAVGDAIAIAMTTGKGDGLQAIMAQAKSDVQSGNTAAGTISKDGTAGTKGGYNGSDAGQKRASGGHITGPGSGTSDSIPAWLSNGEYVVRAKAVGKYGKAFFDNVNAGKFADGGQVGAVGAATFAPAAGGKGGIAGGMFSRLIDQVIGELTAKLEQAIIPVIMSIGEMRVTMDAQAIASDQLLSIQKTLSFDTQMLQMQKLFAQFQIIETRMRADQAYTIALQVINLTRLAQANSKIVNTMTAQWKQWSTQTVADIKLVGQTLVDTFTSINYGELVKMVEAYASGKTAEGDAAKANVLKKANGGYISGPGTGTSDSIPARLSNGEYVIRQSSVARYGTGFLNQVNEGRYQRYADGGLVGAIGETVSNALNKQAQEKIQAAIDAKAAVMSAASVNGTENLTPEQKAAMILRSQKDLGATHAAINADQSHNGLYYQGSGNAHAVGWAGLPFWGVNDIGNAGQTVFAYASGNVLHAGPFENGSYSPGSTVDIEHLNGGQTRYAHLASVAVQPGATVKAGDVLGVAGSDHLHFEWKYMPSLNQREAGGTPPWMHLGGLIEFAKQGGFYSRGLDQMFKANRIGANPAKWDLQTRTPTAGTGLIPYDGAPPPPFAGDVNSLRHPNGGPFDPNVLRWAGIVQQVLAELNLSSGYITGILAQIQQESGGDPNSVNTTDSNAQKGYASFGLMQTIAGTFNSWAKTPGAVSKKDVGSPYGPQDWTAGMTDPYQNIYAGINYALHNYGEGKFALWNSGQNQAYAAGGPVNGRGTSKSDSIPARLSNGEYVIQANSVSKYGTGLFDALNAGRFATGGPVNKNFLDEKEKADTKARSEAKAKALAEAPKNVGLVSTVALMLSDLTNLGRKSMEKEKVAAAAAKKDGTATTDGKVEIKDGLLYGVTSQTIVDHAKQALGTPYSTGGRAGGPGKGFDCSSFAYWAYELYPGLMKNGWGSPEGVGWTGTLKNEGKPRDMGAIKAGDILLHNPDSTGGHAALYIGNGQIQHSANPNKIDAVDVWGGFEQARQILAMANGGLVIPALRKGATINYDNTLANLHKGETVLTNPLTKKLNEGINDLASGGDVSYNVSVNINKANATAAEIEQAVYSALDKKETKAGRSRVVGARR